MQRVVERILNLLAFLLTVNRAVTADEIRHTVAGYDQETDVAFRRTFERDKDLLRSLGVPLRLVFTDRWEVEQGYVVHPDEYALTDPGLTDEERAALWLASRMANLGGESTSAIFKLGGAPAAASGDPLGADLGSDAATLGSLFSAVVDRRKITFRYRGEPRCAAPLGLVHRMGHWYLVASIGSDARTFRVDRVTDLAVGEDRNSFERPDGFRAADGFPEAPWEAGTEDIEAVVRFDASVAWWARRQLGSRAVVTEHRDGSLTAHIQVASPEALIGWLIGFDDAAVLEKPAALRKRFIAHLGTSS
ncbi:MAG: WYL domain-containing protein [Actinomycetota bacterium]